MGSHDGVVSRLYRTRRETGSKCNSELGSPTSPPSRLILSFINLSRRLLSTAAVRPPISFESYASFSPFTPLGAVPVVLSLLPLLFPLSTFHGPMGRKRTTEECNRTAQENGWVPGAHEEEDDRQQTKKELSERYKKNQQEALDQWVM